VQQRAAVAPAEGTSQDTDAVHAAAAKGIATPSTSLPHGATIQQLFGPRHDLSAVQAHTGPEAAASATAMGAKAYATGNHLVLGDQTDLHTVAHEAAHVVQQRGGVQLKGGVGAAGDQYERHADQVANAVVAGTSAEALLDEYEGATDAVAAVQRQEDESKSKTHSEHAKERSAEGRRTGPAFGDAQRARQADVYVQPDGRYVVRGPRGREHIFERDGTHVTSIDRSARAHQGKVDGGERMPITSDEFERFKEILG